MPKAEKHPTFYKTLKSPIDDKFRTITDYAEISDALSQHERRNRRLLNKKDLQSLSGSENGGSPRRPDVFSQTLSRRGTVFDDARSRSSYQTRNSKRSQALTVRESSQRSRQVMSEASMLQKLLTTIKKYHINP